MPELPEVETVRRTLLPLLVGKKILSVEVFYSPCVHMNVSSFKEEISGKRILGIKRKGKHLIFVLEKNLFLLSHLRMEGKYRLEKEEGFAKKKHDLVLFHLETKEVLCYNDQRKFGVFLLKNEKTLQTTPPLSKLGKEPFDLTKEELFANLQKKKGPIKEALLDQSLVAGIGNIYADEILWATKINPLRKANSISLEECASLLENAVTILNEAIDNGGSTVRSYHPSEGVDGRMQLSLHAYYRQGSPCDRCSLPLKKIAVGGRGSTYCPNCQRRKGEKLIIGVTGPIASGKSTVSSFLKEKGFALYDADRIVHELYETKAFQKCLKRQFGAGLINEGNVDRKALLSIVSNDEKKKEALERLVHKKVYETIEKRLKKDKSDRIVLDVPLLIGGPLEERCNAIILITTDPRLQKERLKERGVDVEKSLELNRRYPLEEALQKCTIHIETGKEPLEELRKRLEAIPFLNGR